MHLTPDQQLDEIVLAWLALQEAESQLTRLASYRGQSHGMRLDRDRWSAKRAEALKTLHTISAKRMKLLRSRAA